MPHAIVTPEGAIREVVPKLLPTTRLQPGERIVTHAHPVVDAELYTVQPVQPVPAEATAVEFVVALKPGALDRSVIRAHIEIDAAAGKARARYITVAPGQGETYIWKEAQSRAYKAAGYPADAAPWPLVLTEAKSVCGTETPSAADLQAAADNIIAQADAWMLLAAQIEQLRRSAKIAAAAGTDPESITLQARVACVALGTI